MREDVTRGLELLLSSGNDREFLRALGSVDISRMRSIRTGGGVELSANFLAEIISEQTDAAALSNLGVEIWDHSGGELEALDILRMAAAMGSMTAVAALGEVLEWLGMYEESMQYLARAVADRTTTSPWLEGTYGEALVRVDRAEEAVPYLRSGYACHDDFGLTLSEILINSGEVSEGSHILEALAAKRVFGAAIQLGNVRSESGDNARAIEAYKLGVAEGDGHSAFNLGLVYWEMDDMVSARIAFDVARAMGDLTEPPDLDGDE